MLVKQKMGTLISLIKPDFTDIIYWANIGFKIVFLIYVITLAQKILDIAKIINMNPAIIKKPKEETPIYNVTELHKGYNEKNPTQQQGAFVPDAANQKAPKVIDNKAYKTSAEAKKKPNDSKVVKVKK